jgi:uncharacterized membrane protein
MLMAGFVAAPFAAVYVSARGMRFWKALLLGFVGCLLVFLAFHMPRLAAYEGSCVGIFYFGDRWPCGFAEYAGDQASGLIFTGPLAIIWLVIFLAVYLVDRAARRLQDRNAQSLRAIAKRSDELS